MPNAPAQLSTDKGSHSPARFVEVPLRPRFFQSSAFFPMPVVLLSTKNQDNSDNLAPYSLCFPLVSAEGHRLHLVTKTASKTATNLLREGRVAINFFPDEPALLANCRLLARAVPSAEKMAHSIFTLVESPRASGIGERTPRIAAESVQVFECLLVSFEASPDGEHRFVLEVESILMPPSWSEILEHGGRGPRLPVDYGFRRHNGSWMSRPRVRTSGPRLRPTFEVVIDRSPEQVLADFRAALARPDADVVAKVRDTVLQVGLPSPEVTTWSPSMDLRVEPRDGKSVIYGRIGPQPQVWTTFMFFHMMIALTGLGGLMWGIGQLAAGGSGWPMWIALGAVFMHAFVAGAAFVGQGLGADQVHRLRSFVDEVIDA